MTASAARPTPRDRREADPGLQGRVRLEPARPLPGRTGHVAAGRRATGLGNLLRGRRRDGPASGTAARGGRAGARQRGRSRRFASVLGQGALELVVRILVGSARPIGGPRRRHVLDPARGRHPAAATTSSPCGPGGRVARNGGASAGTEVAAASGSDHGGGSARRDGGSAGRARSSNSTCLRLGIGQPVGRAVRRGRGRDRTGSRSTISAGSGAGPPLVEPRARAASRRAQSWKVGQAANAEDRQYVC